jgi:hypothetical protein
VDFPHIDRCDVSIAQGCGQELFPLNGLLAHEHYDARPCYWDSSAVILLA